MGSASVSAVAGTAVGSTVTAAGLGFSAPLGVAVGIGTSYAVDSGIDYVYKEYTRETLIDVGAKAVDVVTDVTLQLENARSGIYSYFYW